MIMVGSIMSSLKGVLHLPLYLLAVLFLQLHLLSCYVLVSHSSDTHAILRENLRALAPALCHLVVAERDYVEQVFNKNPPLKFTEDNLDPIPGITIPVGNSKHEVQLSICSISFYLEQHLPSIIKNVTLQHADQLLHNIGDFFSQFEDAVKRSAHQQLREQEGRDEGGVPEECGSQEITTNNHNHDYILKEQGLRIIYYTRKWVEDFTNSQPNWC